MKWKFKVTIAFGILVLFLMVYFFTALGSVVQEEDEGSYNEEITITGTYNSPKGKIDITGTELINFTDIPCEGDKKGFTFSMSDESNGRDADSIVKLANSKIGCEYRAGACGPDAFDCSMFVWWVFHKAKVSLKWDFPRSGCTNYYKWFRAKGLVVSTKLSDARAGDIVLYKNGGVWGHTGICVGNGMVTHASDYGVGVIKRRADYSVKSGGKVAIVRILKSENAKTSSSLGEITATEKVALKCWKYLKGLGYSDEAVAGILGNFQQESSMNPKCLQNGRGPAAGIFQRETYNKMSTRWGSMAKVAQKKGKPWYDLESQLEYLQTTLSHELTQYSGHGTYTYANGTSTWWPKKVTLNEFKKIKDIEKATLIFERCFERPSVPNRPNRLKWAKHYYQRFTGVSGGSSVDGEAIIGKNGAITFSGTINGCDFTAVGTINGKGEINAEGYCGGNSGSEIIGSGDFCWPTPKHQSVNCVFGYESYHGWHNGVDLQASEGDKIVASADGTVTYAGYNGSRGRTVEIYHGISDDSTRYTCSGSKGPFKTGKVLKGTKVYTVYQHLSAITVRKGQTVKKGEKVGEAGNTGYSFGSHLHFEVDLGKSVISGGGYGNAEVNPIDFIGTPESLKKKRKR